MDKWKDTHKEVLEHLSILDGDKTRMKTAAALAYCPGDSIIIGKKQAR